MSVSCIVWRKKIKIKEKKEIKDKKRKMTSESFSLCRNYYLSPLSVTSVSVSFLLWRNNNTQEKRVKDKVKNGQQVYVEAMISLHFYFSFELFPLTKQKEKQKKKRKMKYKIKKRRITSKYFRSSLHTPPPPSLLVCLSVTLHAWKHLIYVFIMLRNQ